MRAHRVVERLLVPLTINRPFGHWSQTLIPSARRYPPGSARQVTRNGIRLALDLSDWPQYTQFWGWRHRDHEEIVALVPEDATVLDVGANIGALALRMARKAKRVYAFEANPSTYALLTKNVSLNDDLSVTPVHAAASDRAGQLYVQPATDARNTGMAGVTSAANETPVPAIRLDDFAAAHHLTVGLLKIDTEGHEAAVLQGALGILHRDHPLVVAELNDEHLRGHGSSSDEVLSLLDDLGYCAAALPGQYMGDDFDAVFRHHDSRS